MYIERKVCRKADAFGSTSIEVCAWHKNTNVYCLMFETETMVKLKHCEIMRIENEEKLIFPLAMANDAVKYHATEKNLTFDMHYTITYVYVGYEGRDNMMHDLNMRCKNDTQKKIGTKYGIVNVIHKLSNILWRNAVF